MTGNPSKAAPQEARRAQPRTEPRPPCGSSRSETMRFARGPAIRSLLACALVALSALAHGAPGADAHEDGAVAPQDGWMTEAGNPARTAAGSSRALRRPLEVAWTQTLPGPVTGEPLVTGPWIALDVAAPAGQRTLAFHQRADGRPVAKRQVRSKDPLLACVSGTFVVARTGPARISAFRVSGGQVLEPWSVDTGSPVGSVVAFGSEVYVRTAEDLRRYDIGRREPVWSAARNARGRLALRGGHVYAIAPLANGEQSLVAVSRASGAVDAHVRIGGPHDTEGSGGETRIAVHDRVVRILLGTPLRTTTGRTARGVSVDRLPSGGSVRLGEASLDFTEEDVVVCGSAWLASLDVGKEQVLFRGEVGKETGAYWAQTSQNPGWLRGLDAASVAQDVVYHPRGALDLDSGRILWKPPRPWSRRPVPTRGLLLAVEGDTNLTAYREDGATAAERLVAVGGGLPAEGADACAVLRDGTIVRGKFRAEGAEFVADGKPPRRLAEDEVSLLEDASGKVLACGSDAAVTAALEALADERIAAEAGRVLVDSLGSRDAALLQRLHGAALLRGAPQSDLERGEKRIRDLLRPGKPLPADPAAAAAADARLAAAAGLPAAVAAERLRSLPADAPADAVLSVVRAVLRRDPANRDAAARVRALLPAGVRPPEPFDAQEWADFADAVRRTPVEIVLPVPTSKTDMTKDERAVSIQAHRWGRDVVGVRSRQLLIVTPVARPGAIARCLASGELICSALESVFEKGARRRDTQRPLVLILYAGKEEFERESAKGGHDDLGSTAGFYSPSEELSRLFLPADDEGFARVLRVFAHELTHQWIDERCPYFGFSDRKSTVRTPGYWIVEGFAEFVEQMRFDISRGAWATDLRCDSLEAVAVATPAQLLPWGLVLGADSGRFHEIDREGVHELPFVRRLGWFRKASPRQMFYDQAAAVCSWLWHAEGGARRQALLDYLSAQYQGNPPPLAQAFGLPAEEIGRRTVEFAKANALE